MSVTFLLMSHVTRRPPAGSARAMQSVLYPVKVPISTTVEAAVSWTSMPRNRAWNGGTCIAAPPGSSAVSARNSARMASSAGEMPST